MLDTGKVSSYAMVIPSFVVDGHSCPTCCRLHLRNLRTLRITLHMAKPTIIDIARKAGVGVGTASRALNGAPDVSPATRERVLAAAVALDYHPSAVARRLQGRRSDVVAYVPEASDQPAGDMQFKDFLTMLARSCANHGLDLLIHPLRAGADQGGELTRLIRERRADGIILADTRAIDTRVRYLAEQQLPFVAFGRTSGIDTYAYVDLDSQAGTFAATTHLIERDHRRIAFLGLPLAYTYAQHRLDGYTKALTAHGLPVDEALISADLATETQTREVVRQLLLMPAPPSAIAAGSDLLAIYAMRAAEDFGFQPGRDIAFVGFDDLLLAAHTRPALTTVCQPFDLICDLLIITLLGVIEADPQLPRQQLVQPTLIVRQSS
jgi:LacI family transcriptional regulator